VTTSYTLRGTGKNGCQSESTVTVIVDQGHTAPTVGLPAGYETCNGSMVQLNPVVSGGSGGYQYLWSTGGTRRYLQVRPVENTTYWLEVTDGQGCTARAETMVKGSMFEDYPVSLASDKIDFEESTTLTVAGTLPGGKAKLELTYKEGWRTLTTTIGTVNTDGGPVSWEVAREGKYRVTLSRGHCRFTLSKQPQLVVRPGIKLSVIRKSRRNSHGGQKVFIAVRSNVKEWRVKVRPGPYLRSNKRSGSGNDEIRISTSGRQGKALEGTVTVYGGGASTSIGLNP
ncbi:MAG: hypothetical protein MJB12_01845, partial [Firmicutes bacterium]|nr:hypothetical protein [Bacillota bacterium]